MLEMIEFRFELDLEQFNLMIYTNSFFKFKLIIFFIVIFQSK